MKFTPEALAKMMDKEFGGLPLAQQARMLKEMYGIDVSTDAVKQKRESLRKQGATVPDVPRVGLGRPAAGGRPASLPPKAVARLMDKEFGGLPLARQAEVLKELYNIDVSTDVIRHRRRALREQGYDVPQLPRGRPTKR